MSEHLLWDDDSAACIGSQRFIGHSPSAGRVTVVIAYRDLDNDAGAAKRPHRSQVCSVRLSEEEQARVQSVADARHLPASTLVRSWILERLDQESA